jgi:transposase-like protein
MFNKTMMAGLPKGEKMKRRTYSLIFKQEIAKQALEAERLSNVARKNRLNSKLIYRWVQEYKQGKYDALLPQ